MTEPGVSPEALATLDDEVFAAAAAEDEPALAEVLVRRAAHRILVGAFADAAGDLGDAAAIHRGAGHPIDESRLLQAMATALRLAGQLDAAVDAASRARDLAPHGTPFRIAAETELGEELLLLGRCGDARAAYEAALGEGIAPGLIAVAQAALHRRIAMTHSIQGEHALAAASLATATQLYAGAGQAHAAHKVQVEAATALVEAGLTSAAGAAIASARVAVLDGGGALADHGVLAELELLDSAVALRAGDRERALGHARTARREALEGRALLAYVSAALAIAELLDHAGDREGAYDSLAVGWVTAGDLVDELTAAALFRPGLQRLRARWGADAFDRIKAAYYSTRAARA